MNFQFSITSESPLSIDAALLLDELSVKLAGITGNDGRSSFDFSDIEHPRSLFVVARNRNNEPVGCGALRPLSENVGEIKRMFAKQRGAGTEILKYLENRALELDYQELWLETRRCNGYAVNFYLRNGFRPVPNYDKYMTRPEAICLGKILIK